MDSIFYSHWREDELLADTGAVFDNHYDEAYLQNFHDPTCPIQRGPLDQCPYCFLSSQDAAGDDPARPRRNAMYGLQDDPQQTWEDIFAAASPLETTDMATCSMSHRHVEQLQSPLAHHGPSQARPATVSHLDPQLQERNQSAKELPGAPWGPFVPARGAHPHHGEAGRVQDSRSRSAQTHFAHHSSHSLSAHTAQESRQHSTWSAEQSTPFRHFQHDSVATICHRRAFSRLSEKCLQYHPIQDQRHDTPGSTAPSSSRDCIERLHAHQHAGQAHHPRGVSRPADGISVADRHDTPMTDDAIDLAVPPHIVSPTLSSASALSETSSARPAQRPRRRPRSASATLSTASSSRPVQQPRRTGHQLLVGAFKCPKCDCRFDKRAEMIRHQNRVHMKHSDRPYACEEPGCDQRFVFHKDLLRHQKLHKPHPPVSCPHCSRIWVVFRADNFRRHMQTKHADHLTAPTRNSGVAMSRPASRLSSSSDYRASLRACSSGGDSEDDPLEDLQRLAVQSLEPA